MGEQFAQQGAVLFVADQMHATDAGPRRAHRTRQVAADVGRQPVGALEHGLHLVGGQRIEQFAGLVSDPPTVGQIDQLVGLDRHGDGFGRFFHLQVEYLAGRRRPFAIEQHDVAEAKLGVDAFGIHLAHLAGVLQVDAVENADRLAGDEIAADDADAAVGHRRIGQALREHGLDFERDAAHRIKHAIERRRIGDAVTAVIERLEVLFAQLFLDLRAGAMHQHQANAQADQQIDVVSQGLGKLAGHRLATEGNDEGAAAKGIDVGRDRPEPGDEMLVVRGIAHFVVYFPLSSFSALSRRSQIVLRTLTRAKFLSLASTSVHGARPVELRSTMSQTAET